MFDERFVSDDVSLWEKKSQQWDHLSSPWYQRGICIKVIQGDIRKKEMSFLYHRDDKKQVIEASSEEFVPYKSLQGEIQVVERLYNYSLQ